MRNRNQTIIITTLSILLLVVIALASGVKMNPPTTPKAAPQSQVLPRTPVLPRSIAQTPTRAKMTKPVLTEAQRRAQKINSEVLKMKGIENCSTVVTGNTCLIGCKFSKAVKNLALEKKMIADRIKAMDKSIKTCYVINTTNAIPKINKIFSSNDPKFVSNEIRNMIKGLTPTIR